jgi:hypothetical protein
MSLATPPTIQELQRKLYLKDKQAPLAAMRTPSGGT